MTRTLSYTAFLLGLAAIGWVGAGYVGTHPLALAVTALVGAFYLMGALELLRFQQATSTLERAVADASQPPASLGAWLEQVHPTLRNAVRLRIEGERVGLPGPALAPYLAGLLVLLGMLGTFMGMVMTLNGTGSALAAASDLQAIRASLAAPVKGLGLAFGTSLAGVAASAMLGLMSSLCRRDRLQAAQGLDTRIAGSLRVFSLAHRREESFTLLRQQSELMPQLVDRLQAMMATIERQSLALNERLLANQDGFHDKTAAAYAGLAASVDQTLKQSLTESARVAGRTIQPVVEATMAGMAQTFEQRSAALVEAVSARLEASVDSVSDNWRGALSQHERVSDQLAKDTQLALTTAAASFEQHSASLLRTVDQTHADLQAQLSSRDAQRLAAWTDALRAMAESLRQEWQQAGARSESQQQQICKTLAQTGSDIAAQAEAHARGTIAEIAELVKTASDAPRAAAQVIAELREKLSDGMVRDNAMLEERGRILETLETLLGAVNHASTEQRGAIDALVATSADLLDRVGARFTEKVEAEAGKMNEAAAQITGSAVEVASLGEAFGFAVQLFSESNDKLAAQLQRIEGALGKAIARSDEQLDYYVAQAREVIDLSILSQKQIVEDLQQLAGSGRALAGSEA